MTETNTPGQAGTQRERERARARERERDRQTDRDRKREKEKGRKGERERRTDSNHLRAAGYMQNCIAHHILQIDIRLILQEEGDDTIVTILRSQDLDCTHERRHARLGLLVDVCCITLRVSQRWPPKQL